MYYDNAAHESVLFTTIKRSARVDFINMFGPCVWVGVVVYGGANTCAVCIGARTGNERYVLATTGACALTTWHIHALHLSQWSASSNPSQGGCVFTAFNQTRDLPISRRSWKHCRVVLATLSYLWTVWLKYERDFSLNYCQRVSNFSESMKPEILTVFMPL